jgi:hypothetical protein
MGSRNPIIYDKELEVGDCAPLTAMVPKTSCNTGKKVKKSTSRPDNMSID